MPPQGDVASVAKDSQRRFVEQVVGADAADNKNPESARHSNRRSSKESIMAEGGRAHPSEKKASNKEQSRAVKFIGHVQGSK